MAKLSYVLFLRYPWNVTIKGNIILKFPLSNHTFSKLYHEYTWEGKHVTQVVVQQAGPTWT